MNGIRGKRILLLGATGLVGAQTLDLCLAHPGVAQVIAPTRRALPAHDRLLAPIVDFARLDDWPDIWGVDAAICCLGTTIRAAGSARRFIAIDHDAPLAVAARVRWAGAQTFALVSAIGADPASRFLYTRVKGETERDVSALGFSSTIIARPNVLDGDRAEPRPMERAALALSRALRPVLPLGWRATPAANVARALLDAVMTPPPGVTIIPPRDLA